jgi:hypothetical protein
VKRRVTRFRRLPQRPGLRIALRPGRRIVRRDRTADLRARANSSRGIALTLSPGVPAARCGPVPPRTGHDVIAPDAHTPTVPS